MQVTKFTAGAILLLTSHVVVGCGGKEAAGAGTLGASNPDGGRSASDSGPAGPKGLCASFCATIAKLGCSSGPDPVTCPSDCASLYSKIPQCGGAFDQELMCLSGARLDCTAFNATGTGVCQAEIAAAQTCANGAPSGGMPPSTGSGTPPSSRPSPPGCEAIPPKPTGLSCSGSGSASEGPEGGATTCQEDCRDSQGHSWTAQCIDASCACLYDGKQMCKCTLTTSGCLAASCCP